MWAPYLHLQSYSTYRNFLRRQLNSTKKVKTLISHTLLLRISVWIQTMRYTKVIWRDWLYLASFIQLCIYFSMQFTTIRKPTEFLHIVIIQNHNICLEVFYNFTGSSNQIYYCWPSSTKSHSIFSEKFNSWSLFLIYLRFFILICMKTLNLYCRKKLFVTWAFKMYFAKGEDYSNKFP